MKKVWLLLLLLAYPTWADYSHIQSKSCSVTSGQTMNCQFNASVTSPNLLVVHCAASRPGASLTVTDDNNDYFRIVGGTTTQNFIAWGIWYATANVNSQTVVTCTDTASATTWLEGDIHEYSGNMYLTDPLDVWSSSAAVVAITTTSFTSGPLTTSRNGELIFAVTPKMPNAASAGNGTIRINAVDNAFWAAEDYFQPLAGVYESSFTFVSGVGTNNMSQASFKLPEPPPKGVETWE